MCLLAKMIEKCMRILYELKKKKIKKIFRKKEKLKTEKIKI